MWEHDSSNEDLRRYIIEFFVVGDTFSFAVLNLKISDIEDLYDATTETFTYQFDFAELGDDFSGFFENGVPYEVRVTPRERGGVDLTPYEERFQFSCSMPDCSVLPCEDFAGQCEALLL